MEKIGLINVNIKIGIPNAIAPIFVFLVAIPLNFIMVRTELSKK